MEDKKPSNQKSEFVSDTQRVRSLLEIMEIEFVQTGLNGKQIAKKYDVAISTVYKHIKEKKWKQKREDFLEKIAEEKAEESAEMQSRYHNNVKLAHNVLMTRFAKVLAEDDRRMRLAEKDKKKLHDSSALISSHLSTLGQLMSIGRTIHGEPQPPMEMEMDYEVVVEEQRIFTRRIERHEVETPSEHVIDSDDYEVVIEH
jgi:hypothetical protein